MKKTPRTQNYCDVASLAVLFVRSLAIGVGLSISKCTPYVIQLKVLSINNLPCVFVMPPKARQIAANSMSNHSKRLFYHTYRDIAAEYVDAALPTKV